MFGIGLSELILIGILILIFVKPEDIPALVKTVRYFYQQVTDAFKAIQYEFEDLEHSLKEDWSPKESKSVGRGPEDKTK